MDIVIKKTDDKTFFYIDNELALDDKVLEPEQIVEAMGYNCTVRDLRNKKGVSKMPEEKKIFLEQIFLQLEEVGFEGNYSNYEELENKHEIIMHRCSVAHKLISELIDTDSVVGNEAANSFEEVLKIKRGCDK